MGRTDQGVLVAADRYQVIPRTLCFITYGDEVLLLRGAPDKRIWANRYNGIGGHIERGEEIWTAARREIREETGLEVTDLRLRGIVHVDAGDPRRGVLLFVFTAKSPTRQVSPSREGTLVWVPWQDALQLDLVEDLPTLLPRLFQGPEDASPFLAHYRYDDQDRLVITFADL